MLNNNDLLAILQESEQIAIRKLSARTKTDYKRAMKCLNGLTPQEYRLAAASSKPISASRFRMLKAAFQFHMAKRASEAARTALKYREEDDHSAAELFEKAAQKSIKALRKQAPDYERLRYRDNLPAAHPASPELVNKTKHSKRPLLNKLKKKSNWQSELITELPVQHKLSAAVLILTGCRPSELEKGVIVEARKNELLFTIAGSKITNVSGQKKRRLTFDPTQNKIAAELYEAVSLGTKAQRTKIDLGVGQRAFYEAHVRAAVRAFGDKIGKRLSPYIHRQAFSADLKADGYSREEIALALGHSTDRTQSFYGMAQQSSGNSRGLTKVQASRKIKSTRPAAAYFSNLNSGPKI